MKHAFTFLLAVALLSIAEAQNPLIKKWDKTYGGDDYEFNPRIIQTTDGGYMVASSTWSDTTGDVTEHTRGAEDYWMLKLDAAGNKQWDKRFGGGDYDRLSAVWQTADHGYILGGGSNSIQSGDRTQPNWDPSAFPTHDYWIVKTDSAGNKQWDKRYGGTSYDLFSDLLITVDGGYLLSGCTNSDSSGDKTQDNYWAYDFWIVKTDAQGNKQWDKRYGGPGYDQSPVVHQTTDGGYIIGGAVAGAGGDMTIPGYGSYDYWILKIDLQGNRQWEKRYGTNYLDAMHGLTQTADGGYLLLGYTAAGITGDKTQANNDPSDTTTDIWIIKLDTAGNKQWDKSFGGSKDEILNENTSIHQSWDGGYFFACRSYSPAGGDKTENNLAQTQVWMVKLNAAGAMQWDKTIFVQGHSSGHSYVVHSDGCYTIASGIDADTGGYKTQPSKGLLDVWVVKFCDTTLSSVTPLQSDKAEIEIYPNPFADEVSFSVRKNNLKSAVFKITSATGQTVFSKQENNLSDSYIKTLSLSFLPKGIYFAEVIIDDERVVKPLIRQ